MGNIINPILFIFCKFAMIICTEGDRNVNWWIKKSQYGSFKIKNKNVRAILSVVINKYNLAKIELSTKGKEIADADLLGIIQKTIKELEDERAGYLSVNNTQRVEEIDEQMKTIQSYLPKMLTEEEIKMKSFL